MKFDGNIHLAYSTNIHRGNTWGETFASLREDTMRVREQVCSTARPFGIGLRLSHEASLELIQPDRLAEFRRWLEANNCYVFTINGFPYGNFHGTRVKEQVYVPDWQTPARLDYTKRLFDLLVQLLPQGVEGSVSTSPGSFKPFITEVSQVHAMQTNLLKCARHIELLSEQHNRDLHLGLEPEPYGYLETTEEVIDFFAQFPATGSDREILQRRIGVNYDTCHMAIQFEHAAESLAKLVQHHIRISKVHLSSALSVVPTETARQALRAFIDPVYLHQVVGRDASGVLTRWQDLDMALEAPADAAAAQGSEWRVHFHVPLYAQPDAVLATTVGHLQDTLDFVAQHPTACSHFEFETYTWEVLPPQLRADSVVEQLVAEYKWCLDALAARGHTRM